MLELSKIAWGILQISKTSLNLSQRVTTLTLSPLTIDPLTFDSLTLDSLTFDFFCVCVWEYRPIVASHGDLP